MARILHPRGTLLVMRASVFLLFLGACAFDVRLPSTAIVTCASNDDCPSGFACEESRCLEPGVRAPVATSLQIDVDEDDTTTILFTSDDALAVRITAPPTQGTLTLDGTSATYTPEA